MFPTDTEFDAKVTLETEMSPLADEDSPFNILFMGDWSGRRESLTGSAPPLRPIEIDRDNFDEVMKKFRVGLELSFEDGGDNTLALEFTELDDFHPDKIFQQVPLFSNLRDIRRKLSKADTYNEAAGEVRSWVANDNQSNAGEMKNQAESEDDNQSAPGNLLDQILGGSTEQSPTSQNSNAASTELSAFIGKLVKPHIIQTDTEEQSNLLMVVDEITSDLMRKILHHPRFQALESSWRGAYLMVRKIETDGHLKIFLLDINQTKLSDDLKASGDLADSQIYRLIKDSDKSWALIGGNYNFGLNVDDAATLIRLAKIGNNSNVPFISHIRPEMFGFKFFDEVVSSDKLNIAQDTAEFKLWNALRALPEASHLGLALPRFLSRLPYGAKTEPAESFYFEEFTDAVRHRQYLWTNPTFICVLLLAQSFSRSGWELSNNLIQDIDDLPLYFYQENGETKSKSCAEISMTQSNAEILIEQGLMPLISFRDTDRIRVGRFQSITFSESMLSGKWN